MKQGIGVSMRHKEIASHSDFESQQGMQRVPCLLLRYWNYIIHTGRIKPARAWRHRTILWCVPWRVQNIEISGRGGPKKYGHRGGPTKSMDTEVAPKSMDTEVAPKSMDTEVAPFFEIKSCNLFA